MTANTGSTQGDKTVATMKELRERCAQLGIQPARSVLETASRIVLAEQEAKHRPGMDVETLHAAVEAEIEALPLPGGCLEAQRVFMSEDGTKTESVPVAAEELYAPEQQPSRSHRQGAEIPVREVRVNPVMAAPYGSRKPRGPLHVSLMGTTCYKPINMSQPSITAAHFVWRGHPNTPRLYPTRREVLNVSFKQIAHVALQVLRNR